MNPKRKRILALLLLAVMLVTFVSSVAAASDESAASTPEQEAEVTDSTLEDPVESTEPEEPSAEPSETPSPEPSEEAEPSEAPEVDQPEESPPIEETSGDDDVPRSDDGETLTRAEELFGAEAPAITVRGPLQAKANAGDPTSGSMTKSTCVDFAEYESPTWYCNRYYTEGTHVYGHYFYASTIAYHTIDGVWAYCIEPNTSSLANQPYQSYRADSASSTSYWMRELDSTQRKNIQMILAFGYPECDYGYGQQAQYAATQTLIWEVCCKLRYSDIKSSDSYGLYYKVNAVLGGNYANAYDAIVNAISFSDGTVPSFASSSESSAPTVKLSLNTSTNCYEASVSDSKSVLSHFTFTQSGVIFTKSGSTLKISVPASLASSVKGKVITGTSDQKVLSSSNPLVWENAYYQTVTTAGGADDVMAYFKLDWEDNGGIKLVKKTTDSSIGVSGWTFNFKPTTGDTITKTTGSDGTISLTGLTAGMKYTVTEKAYDGYVQPAAQTVTIEAGKTNTITFTNSPLKGNLTVNKAVNYGTMAGFVFHLKGTSTIGKTVDLTATTDSKGVAKFTDVYVGTYTLSEEDPGAAYIKMADQAVTITANETTGAAYTATVRADNVWKYWSATITKVDSETGKSGNEMDGAEYTLYQNGKAVKVYTIKNGKFTTDEYPCTESDSVYTLKETKAPEGYTLNSTTYKLTTSYTHYTNKVNTFNVTVEDTAVKGKFQIEKWAVNTVSKDKQPEKGATFDVYLKSAGSYAKADEKHRDIITIGDDGKGITKDLPYGVYCIHQKTGWAGYEPDETVYEATISADGATVTNDNDKKDMKFQNDIWTGTLTIVKVDKDSRTPLAGAEFQLKGSDDYKATAATGTDGKVEFKDLVYGVTYEWQETKAPHGYVLDAGNKGIWSVEAKDATIEVTAEDVRRPGTIIVTKQDSNGEPLSGAVFKLEYNDGGTWKPVSNRKGDPITKGGCTSNGLIEGLLTTGDFGSVTYEGLWADGEIQYRLTEVKAPDGYELLKEPVYEGTLPVAVELQKATGDPDEVDGNTAYFYTLPLTVKDGKVFNLPHTGGPGSTAKMALTIIAFGMGLIALTMNPNLFRRKSWAHH